MFSIYIHIPFCSYKCPYCDFNTYALSRVPEEAYLQALLKEIEAGLKSDRVKDQKLTSIYFGGGTPGIFSGQAIRSILDLIKTNCLIESNLEITIEANPKEIELDKLQNYFEAGVNRLSLGAQSLNNKTLLALGRKHQAADIYQAVSFAKDAGFQNISLDLMFAAPNQSFPDLEQDLNDYLALNLPHISCYELTIEKGTPFFTANERGNLKIVDEDQKLAMYQLIRERLKLAGYHHYEISNFGIPGSESRHNQNYWQNNSYLGFGAGAHGCWRSGERSKRYSNLADYQSYIEAIINSKPVVAWEEELSTAGVAFDYIMLGLRTSQGVEFSKLEQLGMLSTEPNFKQHLQSLVSDDLLVMTTTGFALTMRGQEIADSVIESFSKLF